MVLLNNSSLSMLLPPHVLFAILIEKRTFQAFVARRLAASVCVQPASAVLVYGCVSVRQPCVDCKEPVSVALRIVLGDCVVWLHCSAPFIAL